ncbi:MAG: UDP-N-acetylmuramoyl-tripeptide--D-alanyl-D-alanine ligase [Clostridia bacterium]|nr:UDP-N-acetylmuramoyl-tripeptide--D-alanyl-D-alanine ligase [Clostridia bacterium]
MSVELKLRTPSIKELAGIVGGKTECFGNIDTDSKITSVTTSSGEAVDGALFCAIRGTRVDGADFIPDAVSRGAVCAMSVSVPETIKSCGDFAVIVVDDVIAALGRFAEWYRDLSRATFVAITGSVGKTTTKEFVASVAGVKFKTHKTQGNYNNELGLPLTLLGLSEEDEVSVIELGMSDLGEIEYMSKIVKPDIAIVTNIGTSHLATLGTRENICKAKLEIASGLKDDGILLINADEPLLFEKRDEIPKNVGMMSIYNRNGDYRALNIRVGVDGITFDMIYDNKAITNIEIPILGKHNVYNALTAYAVGTLLGMSDEEIRRGLLNFVGAEMRQRIYEIGDLTVIDDCYNASPESMRAALDVLASFSSRQGKRPLALLGDMLELGDYSRLMHDQLGQYAAQSKVSKLFCYGMMSDIVAEAAIKKGIRAENVFVCLDTRDPQTMADMIFQSLEAGDVLLVKASRAIHAEKVIECLKKRINKAKARI